MKNHALLLLLRKIPVGSLVILIQQKHDSATLGVYLMVYLPLLATSGPRAVFTVWSSMEGCNPGRLATVS